jgi:hypothetical protein
MANEQFFPPPAFEGIQVEGGSLYTPGTNKLITLPASAAPTQGYQLIQSSGPHVWSNDFQALMNMAEPRSLLRMHRSTALSFNLTHQNAVVVDTNGYDLARLTDSASSGRFKIIGEGRIGQLMISNTTTDVDVHCPVHWAARTTNNNDGAIDSVLSGGRVTFHREVVLTSDTWVSLQNAVIVRYLQGGHSVSKESTQVWSVCWGSLTGTFTGKLYMHGVFEGRSRRGLVQCFSGAAGDVVIEDATLLNVHTSFTTWARACIMLSDVAPGNTEVFTTFTFRGNCMLRSTGWALTKDFNTNHNVQVEGTLAISAYNPKFILNYLTPPTILTEWADYTQAADSTPLTGTYTGKLHTWLNRLWHQVINSRAVTRLFGTIAERDAATGLFPGQLVRVAIATGDPTVKRGGAYYEYLGAEDWRKVAADEVMDAGPVVDTIGLTSDAGSGTITVGSKGVRRVDFSGKILAYTILAGSSGTIAYDVRKSTLITYPASVSICGSNKPVLLNDIKKHETSLAGWTLDVEPGDILEFIVEGATVSRAQLSLTIERTL